MQESFMKSLFGGVIAEGLVFPYPEPRRAEIDQVHATLDAVRKLCTRCVDAAAIDRGEAIPDDVLSGMKEIGVLGLLVPTSYGGGGLGIGGYARVLQEIAGIDTSLALTVSAHESLGIGALLLFANDELKAKWLPRLAKGETIAAFALAETGAGSDAGSILTRADKDNGDF